MMLPAAAGQSDVMPVVGVIPLAGPVISGIFLRGFVPLFRRVAALQSAGSWLLVLAISWQFHTVLHNHRSAHIVRLAG
jgi:hypothetical protein